MQLACSLSGIQGSTATSERDGGWQTVTQLSLLHIGLKVWGAEGLRDGHVCIGEGHLHVQLLSMVKAYLCQSLWFEKKERGQSLGVTLFLVGMLGKIYISRSQTTFKLF